MKLPTILNKNITIPSAVFRIPMLLVELGVTALGIIIATHWAATAASWVSDLTRHGDNLAWALAVDVILAFALALFMERKRWIRNLSLILHTGLVVLFLCAFGIVYFDVFPD